MIRSRTSPLRNRNKGSQTMNIKRIASLAFATLLAVAAAAGAAQAQDRDQNARDIAALANMKVTLPQAIAAAEQQAGGRAVSADVSRAQGTTRIAVEVVGPQGVKTLLVDAQTGQVTATQDGGQDDGDDD
jgi:uncharacterized membrane protein YkoI